MAGKDCVAIACDKRFGVRLQMVSTEFEKVFQMGPKLFLGLAGLTTDVQTVSERLKFRVNLYEMKEGRKVTPTVFLSILSNLLYERRFGPYFIEPVVAGLDEHNKPFVAMTDLIGDPMINTDFTLAGTASEQLWGICESLWKPDLGPDDLFETCAQALLNAMDRDCLSGWGATVYLLEPNKLTVKHLKGRMD